MFRRQAIIDSDRESATLLAEARGVGVVGFDIAGHHAATVNRKNRGLRKRIRGLLRTIDTNTDVGSALDGDKAILAGDILVNWVECERTINQYATLFNSFWAVEATREDGK
ncbi:unannotated protein [freshwater metagenome]|uniref:Unannotated protein n=1 Tax=freshwater metagenome TaxID=449393 RepID=A0A6J7VQD8_9ZZZZ